jgi:hypothetical protein
VVVIVFVLVAVVVRVRLRVRDRLVSRACTSDRHDAHVAARDSNMTYAMVAQAQAHAHDHSHE